MITWYCSGRQFLNKLNIHVLCIYHICTVCTVYVLYMYYIYICCICIIYVSYMYHISAVYVPYMYRICTVHVPYLYHISAVYVHIKLIAINLTCWYERLYHMLYLHWKLWPSHLWTKQWYHSYCTYSTHSQKLAALF